MGLLTLKLGKTIRLYYHKTRGKIIFLCLSKSIKLGIREEENKASES